MGGFPDNADWQIGMSDLASKWDKSGIFEDLFSASQYVLKNYIQKLQICPIWCQFDPL